MKPSLAIVLACWLLSARFADAATKSPEAVYGKGQAKLVEVMRIGGGPEESEDAPPFVRPRDVRVASDGLIYVLDGEACEIVTFDRNGEFLYRFSRNGEGPGELNQPNCIAIDPFGRIVCYEDGNKRFSLFSRHGKFIRSKKFQDSVAAFRYLPDGRVIAIAGRDHFVPGVMENIWTLSVMDSSFNVAARLDSITTGFEILNNSGGTMMTSRPYEDFLYWCVGPDGRVYMAKSTEYKITVLDHRLAPMRTINRKIPPVKIGGDERAQYLKDVPAVMQPHLNFPDHKPWLEGMFCDSNGYLLVNRAVAWKRPPLLDVYRPDGTLVGELTVPDFRRPVFDGDSMLMRVFKDDELPAVIRYRLE